MICHFISRYNPPRGNNKRQKYYHTQKNLKKFKNQQKYTLKGMSQEHQHVNDIGEDTGNSYFITLAIPNFPKFTAAIILKRTQALIVKGRINFQIAVTTKLKKTNTSKYTVCNYLHIFSNILNRSNYSHPTHLLFFKKSQQCSISSFK